MELEEYRNKVKKIDCFIPEEKKVECCGNCRFSSKIIRTGICSCRRYAPGGNGHPVVKNEDWCGDYKKKRNK